METSGSPGGPHLWVQSYKLISEPLQYFLKLCHKTEIKFHIVSVSKTNEIKTSSK